MPSSGRGKGRQGGGRGQGRGNKPTPRKKSARLEGVEPSPLETEKEWEEQPAFGTTKLIDWINQISDWITLDARENTLFSSDIISFIENHQKLKPAMREEQAQRHFINEMIRFEFPYVRMGPWQRLQFWQKGGRLAYNKHMQATSIALTPPTKNPKTAVPMTHITNVMPTDLLLTPNSDRPVIRRRLTMMMKIVMTAAQETRPIVQNIK
jgi:hypothetical protein